MTKAWCVIGRHYSSTVNQNVYEDLKSKTHKLVKFIRGTCRIRGRNKSQVSTI